MRPHNRGAMPSIATRRAAPLRPPRNGRIGFKPPYSKRETAVKAPYGVNLLWEAFLLVKTFQSCNPISRRL